MKNIQHWTYINTKISKKFKFIVVYKIRITARLPSIREVATLFSLTRITYKLNKDTFLSNSALLYKLFKIKFILTQNKYKYKYAVAYTKIEITAGLISVRGVAALYRSRG